ncbi:MAG: ParA family protein [Clostridia bacterium]|nr:ParA family protein [Clostridia bacterium]
MKTVAIINQKGGVGKSTTALSIGAGLVLRGKTVLFIDLDAQANLSHTLRAQPGPTAMDLLTGTPAAEIIQNNLIPASPELAAADTTITQTGKEYRLKEALEQLSIAYDYAIIDTPPALGILTINALTASDGVIIPAQADIYSLQGISQLYGTVETVRRYCNPGLKVMGILLTRYNSRAVIGREAAEMIEDTAAQLNTRVYAARVRECTAIKESQAVRENIFKYAPKSNAAFDYAAVVEEILQVETRSKQ